MKLKVEYKATGKLIPYANNARTHSESQVKQIAASIKEFGFTNPVLIDEDNGIIAGHGRLQAAEILELDKVPTITLTGLSDAQRRAYIIADNKLAMNAGWDEELLKLEIDQLSDDSFELNILGFELSELDLILNGPVANYTRKIESPIYEITGEKPKLLELVDDTKTKELQRKIQEADLDKNIADFLNKAAERHTVFDFAKIAEYYAHMPEDIQKLMEESALVIIDFDQAIESGFVKLTKDLLALREDDSNEE